MISLAKNTINTDMKGECEGIHWIGVAKNTININMRAECKGVH